MAYRVVFTEDSGIEPREQTVDAEMVKPQEDEYVFYDGAGRTVRIVPKGVVMDVRRED